MEKRRSEGIVSGDAVVGDVAGRQVIVVDDLVSSGTTLNRAISACRARGALLIHAAASHGLFLGKAGELLSNPDLESLAVTDSVPPFRLEPRLVSQKLRTVKCAPLFAEAIRRMHTGESVLELLQDRNAQAATRHGILACSSAERR